MRLSVLPGVSPSPSVVNAREPADEQKYKPDLSVSGVEVLPVQGNVYLIATGRGSNIVAQVGDQGALLVDASLPDVSDQVIAEVQKPTRGLCGTVRGRRGGDGTVA